MNGLTIRDVTLRRSPAWTVHPTLCTDVLISGITLESGQFDQAPQYAGHNVDGVDPDSCTNVVIEVGQSCGCELAFSFPVLCKQRVARTVRQQTDKQGYGCRDGCACSLIARGAVPYGVAANVNDARRTLSFTQATTALRSTVIMVQHPTSRSAMSPATRPSRLLMVAAAPMACLWTTVPSTAIGEVTQRGYRVHPRLPDD